MICAIIIKFTLSFQVDCCQSGDKKINKIYEIINGLCIDVTLDR